MTEGRILDYWDCRTSGCQLRRKGLEQTQRTQVRWQSQHRVKLSDGGTGCGATDIVARVRDACVSKRVCSIYEESWKVVMLHGRRCTMRGVSSGLPLG